MADQVEGNSHLLQAAMTLADQLLRLVPLLLGACAHLAPELPLQLYWGAVSLTNASRQLFPCAPLCTHTHTLS